MQNSKLWNACHGLLKKKKGSEYGPVRKALTEEDVQDFFFYFFDENV